MKNGVIVETMMISRTERKPAFPIGTEFSVSTYERQDLVLANEPGQLLQGMVSRILKAMEVHFTPEQEAQLSQIATKAGTDPERLVKDLLARYLDDEARFLAAVEKGLAAAERGEFIEEEEMDARLERMFSKT
jgi:predicted transcriptional regulator